MPDALQQAGVVRSWPDAVSDHDSNREMDYGRDDVRETGTTLETVIEARRTKGKRRESKRHTQAHNEDSTIYGEILGQSRSVGAAQACSKVLPRRSNPSASIVQRSASASGITGMLQRVICLRHILCNGLTRWVGTKDAGGGSWKGIDEMS